MVLMADGQEPTRPVEPIDRRVRRTRSALLSAAVRLVDERGTTDISVTDLAEAADISRRTFYQHFNDRDALLVAAVTDLLTRELTPQTVDGMSPTLMQAHFVKYQRFYRALLTGPCAQAVTEAASRWFQPYSAIAARELFGELDDRTANEVAEFFTGGTIAAFRRWVADAPEPADLQEFAQRIARIQTAISAATRLRLS